MFSAATMGPERPMLASGDGRNGHQPRPMAVQQLVRRPLQQQPMQAPPHPPTSSSNAGLSFAEMARANTWLDPSVSIYAPAAERQNAERARFMNGDGDGRANGHREQRQRVDSGDDGFDTDLANGDAEPLCPYYATGYCRYGDTCIYLHGLPCPQCHRNVLHPFSAAENQRHAEQCMPGVDDTGAECSICLERVLSKPDPRFGLLMCDHVFCLECIRNWRGTTTASAESAQQHRSCPLCRVASHHVVPSQRFFAAGLAKDAIIAEYKAKLSNIHCKYFNFGEGTCPFGSSCFYAHVYRDGSREQIRLRKYVSEDEQMHVMTGIKLSDFIVVSDLTRSGATRADRLPTH
eukprot:Unigene10130_Nuclearia_a/m.30929 Unigene10130_Nuclearia_a/g.30929  ORF Unigene10130_Nuclearia_a/g.30929 Unigene10130_Nuclearia_a/m.30929 type:complete len:348 (+) Unigene10130_Nuclearia_a:123-1166(+)